MVLNPRVVVDLLNCVVVFGPVRLGRGHVARVKIPRRVHNLAEVGIVVDACGNIGVVFDPLLHADFPIWLFIFPSGVVAFKVLKKLVINLSFGLAALKDCWVSLGAVKVLNVFIVDDAAAVTIKRFERAFD